MSYIENFIAYDENEKEYPVTVHGTLHTSLAGEAHLVKSFSLTETGEVLESQKDNSRVFRIKSKNILILDIRDT